MGENFKQIADYLRTLADKIEAGEYESVDAPSHAFGVEVTPPGALSRHYQPTGSQVVTLLLQKAAKDA